MKHFTKKKTQAKQGKRTAVIIDLTIFFFFFHSLDPSLCYHYFSPWITISLTCILPLSSPSLKPLQQHTHTFTTPHTSHSILPPTILTTPNLLIYNNTPHTANELKCRGIIEFYSTPASMETAPLRLLGKVLGLPVRGGSYLRQGTVGRLVVILLIYMFLIVVD